MDSFHKLVDIIQFVERTGSPELLPIFRSQQQAEVLADILDNPDRETSLTELSKRLGIPAASLHREIERAESAGIVRSRKIGNTRLIAANPASPYFGPLRQVLVMAFGVPSRLRHAFDGLAGVHAVHIFGSYAARWHGEEGGPVGDIDVLVLGDPDRTEVYAAASRVSEVAGREVNVQFRHEDWIDSGSGSFYETLTARPMVSVLPAPR